VKHDLEEWITEAIMSKTPLVIVEGKDDIQFYERLLIDIDKQAWVDAVENIEGFSEGCDEVVRCIESLQIKIEENLENIKYILGIIDKDAKYFRGELKPYTGLFVLKHYSYESHFTTRNNLKKLLSNLTYASDRLINKKTFDYIEQDLESVYKDLYYISLEALKNACVKDYKGEIGYKEKIGKLFAREFKCILLEKLYAKQKELDDFAKKYNISVNDIKDIAKGKWLLYVYCNSVYERIKKLHEVCESGIIDKCQYCQAGNKNKCLWKPKATYQLGQIIVNIQSIIDENEVLYIKNRLSLLA